MNPHPTLAVTENCPKDGVYAEFGTMRSWSGGARERGQAGGKGLRIVKGPPERRVGGRWP